MYCQTVLEEHKKLSSRRLLSARKLDEAKQQFSRDRYLKKQNISIFSAGSLARMEIGENSDLDLFVISDSGYQSENRLNEIMLFSRLVTINDKLSYPTFSNDGEYLKIYPIEKLRNFTGSRRDDSENLFTARMLLMLESKPLLNESLYAQHLNTIVSYYYRDNAGKKSFRPLFLLNDLLRYWRTLCLNYEERRHDADNDRPWRKKNVNLKFSRMVTVFSTVLPLVAKPISTPEEFLELCQSTPLERLAKGLDTIDDPQFHADWSTILDDYQDFISWKENYDIEKSLEDKNLKAQVNQKAKNLSGFLYKALTHERINNEYKQYLVL